MPPTLYLVGSDKPYTTWQAAIDASVLDYSAVLTADIVFRGNAGETFPDGGFTHLMDDSAMNKGVFRMTYEGENILNPCILDRGDVSGSRFALVTSKKFTFRGFKITLNKQDHTILGAGNCDGSIVEQNDIEARGSHMFNCGALSSLTPFIVRNNYFHGRDGVFRGSSVHRNNNENMIFVGNTYRHTARIIDAGGEWLNGDFIKWFDNIVVDQDSTTPDPGYGPADYGAFLLPGTLAQFNARWQANGNLYFNTAAPILNLYNIPAQYTLAQYQALASSPDANVVTSDPLLTSFADPHISQSSPARWAGVDNVDLTEDIDGQPRHSPPSIGCDEPGPFTPPPPEPTPLPGTSSSVPSDSIKHVLSSTRFQGSTVLDTTNEVGRVRLQSVATLRDTFLTLFEATNRTDVHLNTSAGNKLKAIAALNPSTATVEDIINAARS